MKTPRDLAAELGTSGVADPAATLSPADRARLTRAIERQRERGLAAHVVIAEPGRPLGPLRSLWALLGLREQQDLLLLYNGERWEAKGWGLSSAQIGEALDGAESALREQPVAGFALALERLGALVPGGGPPWAALGAGALALTGLGWVIARRRKLGSQRKQRIATALASAEAVHADVVLAAEALPTPQATEAQLRAATLSEGLQQAASSESEALAVGRLAQLESELNALHAEVLAKTRHGQGEET